MNGEREGWRERKRRETASRIAEAGLRLFAERGYDATTLDAIADASGIARRTVFHYYRSKEEILLAWQRDLPERFRAILLTLGPEPPCLDAILDAHLRLVAHYDAGVAAAIDQVIRSSERLSAANQAKYLALEQVCSGTLRARWPGIREERSRILAMVSTGALRVAIETWDTGQARRPLRDHVAAVFAFLRHEMASAPLPRCSPDPE